MYCRDKQCKERSARLDPLVSDAQASCERVVLVHTPVGAFLFLKKLLVAIARLGSTSASSASVEAGVFMARACARTWRSQPRGHGPSDASTIDASECDAIVYGVRVHVASMPMAAYRVVAAHLEEDLLLECVENRTLLCIRHATLRTTLLNSTREDTDTRVKQTFSVSERSCIVNPLHTHPRSGYRRARSLSESPLT
jgi:hypothetical protein